MTLNCISLHFIVFKPLKIARATSSKSLTTEEILSPVTYGVLSPVKLVIPNFSIMKKISYKWVLKKSGPNIKPCNARYYFFPGAIFIANFSSLEAI